MATTMATAAIATTKKRKVDQEELDSFSAQPDSLDPAQQPVPPVADGFTEDAGAEAVEDDDEDVAKLLEPLHRDLLIDLLRSAAASDPRTLAEIRSAADRDPAHRKIFVHGLGWETNSEGLRSAFAAYGEIEDCNVVVDRATGKSRGYGFLLFRHRRSAVAALRESQKRIDGRMTSSQLASAGPPTQAPAPPQQQQPQTQNYGGGGGGGPHHDNLARKIYVGNVSADISGDRLLEFFSRFGEVEEGPVGFDRNTGKPRGFALFVYKTVEGANKALEEPNKVFEGHQLYCQKAQDSSHKRGGGGSATASASTTGHRGGSPPPGFGPLQQQQQQQQQTYMDMGLQNARLLMGALQPNPAALALLGVPPAVIAAAMGAAASPAIAQGPSPTPLAGPPIVQGYGMGVPGYQNAGYQNAGYQNAGYQNTGYENVGYPNAGYQAPPQQPPQPQQQQPPPISGTPNVYQGAPMGQPGPPRPMGGYMPH